MYDHVFVALDGSEPSRCAGQFAIAIVPAHDARAAGGLAEPLSGKITIALEHLKCSDQ